MKRCLIVVDMLNDFIREDGALYCGDAARVIIPQVKKRIAATRRAKGEVVFLCDAHQQHDPEFKRFPPHAVKGTAGAQIIDEIQVKPRDSVVQKRRLSGFYGTRVASVLKEVKPDVVDVVGVCTSICVMDLVTGLRTRGYEVVVHRDAVADFDREAHDFALRHMAKVWGAKTESD